jgi:bifunctional DNase/RNase
MLLKAIIAGLTMDPATNTPIIILKTEEGDQAIPIWIGLLEATSIASALQKIKFDRPMTHDLFKNFAESQGISVSSIEVCDLQDNTYYARINFLSRDEQFSMDARPSDAIGIALRFDAPVFISEEVIAKARPMEAGAEALDDSEEGRKWKEYLENLSPEDFGKYKV